MQLIHIERVSATSDDERLGFLLTARAKAAEQVVAANVRAATDAACPDRPAGVTGGASQQTDLPYGQS
jgi:hypothetical protein